ncbi:MAG: TetR/AcrR family transcriptional regulator [Erysipelotrichaceae bacterium]|nr:TetR/AcrR family transcriptional regulator [Erysipelotrichaceae bacterium]
MAQVLKENLRRDIIEAAKEEFLVYGYKDASMRRIAAKAHMTVGNLYRYFENKEDINMHIVVPTLEKINKVLKQLTTNKISFETRVFNVSLSTGEIRDKLDVMSEQLVDIYVESPQEFKILMLHSRLNEKLTDWFSGIIKTLIMQNYPIAMYDKECDVLSRCFAVSIFDGFRELFNREDLNADELKQLSKIYFRTLVYILDTDIRRFL